MIDMQQQRCPNESVTEQYYSDPVRLGFPRYSAHKAINEHYHNTATVGNNESGGIVDRIIKGIDSSRTSSKMSVLG